MQRSKRDGSQILEESQVLVTGKISRDSKEEQKVSKIVS
jgi:hypothetical protein